MLQTALQIVPQFISSNRLCDREARAYAGVMRPLGEGSKAAQARILVAA
ncbi:hypothetical protein ACJ3XI_10340 [Litorimonas sp. RW-G-Af-16]